MTDASIPGEILALDLSRVSPNTSAQTRIVSGGSISTAWALPLIRTFGVDDAAHASLAPYTQDSDIGGCCSMVLKNWCNAGRGNHISGVGTTRKVNERRTSTR